MKKKLLTFLFASLFVVTGCNSNSYPQYVLDSSWGKDKACTMYDTFHALIPYMEANDYEFVYSVDEYGDDMLSAFFYYESDEASEKANEDYINLCASKGYEVEVVPQSYVDWDTLTQYTYTVSYASKVIKGSIGFEMQFLASVRGGKSCLGVFAYNYVYCPKDSWPNAAVEHLLGNRANIVPTVTGGSKYEFLWDVDSQKNVVLEIQITGLSVNVEEEYFNTLKSKGITSFQFDELDEDHVVAMRQYEEFVDQYYYCCYLAEDVMLIYDFDVNSMKFIIDIWLIK